MLAVGNRHRREQKNGSPEARTEVAHLDARVDGTIEMQTATMDIADYLKQGGQTAGHRELWRLLRTLFEETNDTDELID